MSILNNKFVRYLLQAINYTVFMAIIWYFSTSPAVHIIAEDEAMITIAFAHAGNLREPCRKLSVKELMKLAPNMRKPEECPRERSPVVIKAMLDGKTFYDRTLQPPGIFNDGSVDVFFSGKIPAGKHHLKIKMNDSVRVKGFNHVFEQDIDIEPTKILLIEFNRLKGFFIK